MPTDTLVFHEQIEDSVNGHAAVLRALTEQDAEAARAAMTSHIEDTRVHTHQVLSGDRLRRSGASRTGSRRGAQSPKPRVAATAGRD